MIPLVGTVIDQHTEIVFAGGKAIESLVVSFAVPIAQFTNDLVGREVDIEVAEDGTIVSISLVEEP